MVDLNKILEIATKIIELEGKIEKEIRKEKDAKKRKKLREAFKNRDADSIRKLLFE